MLDRNDVEAEAAAPPPDGPTVPVNHIFVNKKRVINDKQIKLSQKIIRHYPLSYLVFW